MAAAAPHGGSLVPLPVTASDWSSLCYGNANVRIRDGAVFLSESRDGGVVVRLLFEVNVFCPVNSTEPSSSSWWERRSTTVELGVSSFSQLQDGIIDDVLGRPVPDDVADFLVISVGLFADGYARRSSGAAARYDRNLRVAVIELHVTIILDETVDVPPRKPESQPKKVAYEGEGGGGGGSSAVVRETACPICLQDFVMGEEVDVTPCEHPFHPCCLGRWLEQQDSCPLCRSKLR